MGLILSDRVSAAQFSLVEQKVNRLRFELKAMRWNGETKHQPGQRERNAMCMRKLWKIAQTSEVLCDYSQRAFLALCVGEIPARAIAVNAKGEEFFVNLSLDVSRSYQYRLSKSSMVPYVDQTQDKSGKPGKSDDECSYDLLRLKEFCDTTVQKKANSAVVQLHNVKLMMAWHNEYSSKATNRVRCVNIDNTYNTFDRERPNYRRRHLALPVSKLDLPTLQARAAAFCDSARLIGERSVLQVSYTRKPRHNAVLSVLSEASMIVNYCYSMLQMFTEDILNEVSMFKGFDAATKTTRAGAGAATMIYAKGVILYSGRHATSVYTHEQLKYDAIKRLVAVGAMTVDIPRFSFRAPSVAVPNQGPGRLHSTGEIVWDTGREFLRKHIDTPVQSILRAYSRK